METNISTDQDLMKKAFQESISVYTKILKSYQSPENVLDEYSMKIFLELKKWGLLEIFKFNTDLNSVDSKAILIFIAKEIYKNISIVKAPKEEKKGISKWEYVMGKARPKGFGTINKNKRI